MGSNDDILKCRQEAARMVGRKLAALIEEDHALRDSTSLVIWHGSLTHGRGGQKYDIDYAIFARCSSADDLLHFTSRLSQAVEKRIDGLRWRRDTHYDAISMFEAHVHWDHDDPDIPPIGVHLYRHSALDELFADQPWAVDRSDDAHFFRLLVSWQRFAFFWRNWIYEGEPVYDPSKTFERARGLQLQMPAWMQAELETVVRCILRGYSGGHNPCSDDDGIERALQLTSLLAYAREGIPPGRSKRFADDASYVFRDQVAAALLAGVAARDIMAVTKILGIEPIDEAK